MVCVTKKMVCVTIFKRFLTALQFLTIIPARQGIKKEDLPSSLIFFPLVGICIGFFLALINFHASRLFSPLTVNAIILGGWIMITGALHLEGFADMADGFSCAKDKEGTLKVMQDPCCGAKAVVAVICLLLIKFVMLQEVPPSSKFYALLLAPTLSRWSMVMAIRFSRSARQQGMGQDFIAKVKNLDCIIATLFPIIMGICFLQIASGINIILLLAFTLLITLSFIFYCTNKIGGMTGDTLGALNEIIEMCVLALVIIGGASF